MTESTELLVINETSIEQVFIKRDGLEEMLSKIESEVNAFVPDVSTKKGRDDIKAFVTKITRSKTYAEKVGKDLSAELKLRPSVVDATRNYMWERLQAMQDKARKPLTDWEDEQARLKAEEEARLEAIENQRVIDSDYEIAVLLMERDFKHRKEDAEEAERIRLAHEQKIKDDAAAKAKLDAEKAAQELIDKAESDRLAAVERERQAESAKLFAEQQLITQKADAEKAIIEANKKRLADIEAAKQLEIQKQAEAKEEEEKKLAEAAANTEHVASVNRSLKEVYIAAGFPDEWAVKAVKLLVNNKLPHTTFNY